MTQIDVRDFGAAADATGRHDNLAAFRAAFAAARRARPVADIVVPAAPDPYWFSDTAVADAAGGNMQFMWDTGAKAKLMGGRAQNPDRSQGRHLLVIQNVATFVWRGGGVDYNGAAQPHATVGDTVRIQRFGLADVADVRVDNPKGLTTYSTPTMPETFALHFLRGKSLLAQRCGSFALDGAPTATGIVAHWVDTALFRDCFSGFVTGQGFGVYGCRLVGYERCWAHANGHNYNFEGGDTGVAAVRLGDPKDASKACASTSARNADMVINGNPGVVRDVEAYHMRFSDGRDILRLAGASPGRVLFQSPEFDSPWSNIVNLVAGRARDQVDVSRITILDATFKNPHGARVLSPRNVHTNPAWQIHG